MTETLPSVAPSLTEGFDISLYSGEHVDFPAFFASGFRFVICRASVETRIDVTFAKNVRRASDAGLIVGSYHGFWDTIDPETQARFYHTACLDAGLLQLPRVLSPMNDWEDVHLPSHSESIEKAFAFTLATESLWETGENQSYLYTFPSFLDSFAKGSDARIAFGKRRLAIAHYGVKTPTVPTPWTSWDIWQHAGNAIVHGSLVDLDTLRGEIHLLKRPSPFPPVTPIPAGPAGFSP